MKNLILLLSICFLYAPVFSQSFIAEGNCSYYSDKLEGRSTASGEPYRAAIFTAAHKTLPFGTKVMVTNKVNGKTTVVRINDRGPFVESRIIDLSRAAAQEIGIITAGIAPVKIRLLDGNAPVSQPAQPTFTEKSPVSQPYTRPAPPVNTRPAVVSQPTAPATSTILVNSKTIQGNHTVQIGSFRSYANAQIEMEKYKSHSFASEMRIYETWRNGQKLFKLLVGTYHTKEAASIRLNDVKNNYQMDCFIFSVKK